MTTAAERKEVERRRVAPWMWRLSWIEENKGELSAGLDAYLDAPETPPDAIIAALHFGSPRLKELAAGNARLPMAEWNKIWDGTTGRRLHEALAGNPSLGPEERRAVIDQGKTAPIEILLNKHQLPADELSLILAKVPSGWFSKLQNNRNANSFANSLSLQQAFPEELFATLFAALEAIPEKNGEYSSYGGPADAFLRNPELPETLRERAVMLAAKGQGRFDEVLCNPRLKESEIIQYLDTAGSELAPTLGLAVVPFSLAIQQRLVALEDASILGALAMRPELDPHLLQDLLRHPVRSVQNSALRNPSLRWDVVQSYLVFRNENRPHSKPRRKQNPWESFEASYHLSLIASRNLVNSVSRLEGILGVLDDTERDEFCRDLASRPKLPVEIMDFLWAQDQENLKEILAVRWDIPKELRQRWLEAKKGKRWTTSDHTLQRNSHIPANEFHCPENWVRKQSDWWRPSEAPGLVQEFAAAPSRRVKAVILHDRAGDDLPDWGVFYYQTPYRMTLWQRPGDDRWLGAVIGLKEALTANLPRNLAPGYAFASNYGTLMAHGSVSHEDGRQHIWRRKLEKIRRLPWSCSFELGTGLKTEQLCSPSLVVLTDGSIFCQWSSKQGVVGWTNEGGLPVPTERKLDPADLIKVDYTGLKEQLRQMGSAGLHL